MNQPERINRINSVRYHLDNLKAIMKEYRSELRSLQAECTHRNEHEELEVYKDMATHKWTCRICQREVE